MCIGSGGARPQEEGAPQVESDLEHDARSCCANELEQPLDLLAFLRQSELRLGENVCFVERSVLRDPANSTQLSQCFDVTAGVPSDSVFQISHIDLAAITTAGLSLFKS